MYVETHLSEEEIAVYIDALVLDVQDHLPEEMKEHVVECLECKVEVMEVLRLIEAIGPRPTFDYPAEQLYICGIACAGRSILVLADA